MRRRQKSPSIDRVSRILQAAKTTQAMIYFRTDGTIIDATDAFLGAVGYAREEIVGRKHAMFMPEEDVDTPESAAFWDDLRAGRIADGEFKRKDKAGNDVWLNAKYTPIWENGEVVEIIQISVVISARKSALEMIGAVFVQLGEGDLRVRVPNAIDPAYSSLRDSFNSAMTKLESLIGGFMTQSTHLRGTASDVQDSASQLADKTASQVQTLEESAAAVHQISGQLKTTTQAARALDSEARRSADLSLQGRETVQQTTEAMRRIEEMTGRVSETTTIIESFAFQTKLLSLNAAVEAARAGEAGQGFAVVASEVRELANKSSDASQKIAELTKACEEQVAEGARLATRAGEALQEIEDAAAAVATSIKDIAAAAEQQSLGVNEIEAHLSQLSSTLTSVARLSDRGRSQSEELLSGVDVLSSSAGQFTTSAFKTEGGVKAAAGHPDRQMIHRSAAA